MQLHLIAFLNFIAVATSQEILGCGGFVKADVGIDFSQIEIQLLTVDGILKYQTECAPNNGYFMVPFVDKGAFILKIEPPKGWKFEPTSVNLNVDGMTDPCTTGKDINFIFKGFMLTGQILTVGSNSGGPKDVEVALSTPDSGSYLKTTTVEDGHYSFEGVLPGKYKVIASHPSYTFKQKSTEIVVVNNNMKCPSKIFVSGFDVHGHVTAQSLPVSGVHLLLFTDRKLTEKIAGCDPARPNGSEMIGCESCPLFVCATTSGKDGNYYFPSLPPAQYSIIPFHRGDHIKFDVEPQELKFSVVNSRVDHSDGFKVTGFSVQGRVLDSINGKPVSGARITVDGVDQDITDGEGYYTLNHMQSGSIKVAAAKEGRKFEILKMNVGPDTPKLPTIVTRWFSVCGKIHVDEMPADEGSITKLSVEAQGQTGKPEVTKVRDNGDFCFMLSQGSFKVTIIGAERGSLVITPPSQEVSVADQPIKSLKFSQYRASLSVQISCIESCKDVKLELTSSTSNRKIKKLVTGGEKQVTMEVGNILPGKYAVTVTRDNWCWETESLKVEISRSKKPDVITFKQSGFQLVCSISHDIEMKIHYSNEKIESFPLKKGRSRLCLSRTGEYLLEAVSCHRFDLPTPIKYNTARPKVIALQAVAHEAVVAMETKQKLDAGMGNLLIIKSSTGKVAKEPMVLSEDNTKTGGSFVYKASYWAADGEQLDVTPTSDLLLFDPPTTKVTMKSGHCLNELVRFHGIVGKFLSGHVTPALENVDIVIATVGREKIIRLKTDKNGQYREGPLHPDMTYEISADLDDYAVTKVDGTVGDFVAKKLSKLIFKIELENSDTALPGVLLSISGGVNYRSNNLTGSDGTLTLKKLEPGQYYFKAMMKEYKFNPSAQVIDVAEGAHTEIKISGKRVAFSIMGSVTSLNGEPEQDISIRALSKSEGKPCAGLLEEGATSSDGLYRVRGLRPGCVYDVTVHDGARRFSHVTPESVTLHAGEEDHAGLRFIAFRQLTGFELSGNVATSVDYLPFIKMVLYRANDTTLSQPVHAVSLSRATPFFHLPTLPRDETEYVLRLESSLSTSVYDFTSPAAGFFAAGPHKHITFKFEPEEKKLDVEIPQVSVLTLPFTILVILIAYYHTQVLQQIQVLIQLMMGRKEASQETRSGRKQKK